MNRIGNRLVEPAGEARVAAEADVVVVGLGAVGSAVLYQLVSRGIDVIGIDDRNGVGKISLQGIKGVS